MWVYIVGFGSYDFEIIKIFTSMQGAEKFKSEYIESHKYIPEDEIIIKQYWAI